MPHVYQELRNLGDALMAHERPNHTLSPTALVHEAFVRLIDATRIDWKCRAHFFAIASEIMRHVLVDYARRRRAQKRGGQAHQLALSDAGDAGPRPVEVLALDEALEELDTINERQRRVVEMRFFGGLSEEEISEVLDVSPRTVRLDWHNARVWLREKLSA
jgi:RNA polymerase sigma factor (TIGR02999 family)